MKSIFKFGLFSFFFVFILLSNSSFTISKVKNNENKFSEIKKRGAILDRNFEPIVVSNEFYKVYYLVKDSFFSHKPSPLVSKYLPSPFDLPKKGVILLSDKLNFNEVEIFKNEENIFIETYYIRTFLQPSMKFLIGEVINENGISGLEKTFNEILKEGNWVRISLDNKLQEYLYSHSKNNHLSGMIVNLRSGEVLAYFDPPENSYFVQYFSVLDFGIPIEEISSFQWELGEVKVIKETFPGKITPLHLTKWIFNKVCNNTYELTLLPRPFLCEPSLEFLSKLPLTFYLENKILYFTFKKDNLIALITETKENPNSQLNYLKYLAQKL